LEDILVRKVISTETAPAAIGPYSQAIRCGDLLFVSGQVAIDPASGDLVGDEVGDQTRRALENGAKILKAGGSGLDRVVKTTVYLTDMGNFARMNEVYAGFFGSAPPARATVAVAGLPKGALVEVDFVALVGEIADES
jgi:2-iminobutanoate/2-iminopropanoate deaminase